jgi:hypothetical protein
MALSTLTLQAQFGVNANGAVSATGLNAAPGSQPVENTSQKFGTPTPANNAAFGTDLCYMAVLTITASSNTTLDLTALTGIANDSVNFAKLKGYRFHLLGATETAPDASTAGTACSSITVGNAAANAHPLNMGGTTPTFDVGNAGIQQTGDGRAAGFSQVVDGTHKNIKILNNDGVNSAKVVVTIWGTST